MKRDPDDAYFLNSLRNFLGKDPIPELGKQPKEKETQKCSNLNLSKQSKPQ